MPHLFTNRLVHETSPYLQQHAHNPVDWFAWGDEALKKAKDEDKVILVSIGYSACHWCHVMERESFENESTAQQMNEHFVNIKIDREERPDLDHIYMDAVQAMTGSGGWPLNVFLTPEAKPFFGGTYFPPVTAFNRSSWTDVLKGIATAWQERREEIRAQAERMTAHLENAAGLTFSAGVDDQAARTLVDINQCQEMFTSIMQSADRVWGGFGRAPKFPQTFTLQFLLQYHHFTGNQEALQQAVLSIDKMLTGGIYDHVRGGLARYSTDTEWLAPHFEKMLYDNALLVSLLCDVYQLTGARKYEDAIRKTLAFITREMTDPSGGFYAALDADSEGEEGRYYVWSRDEINGLLGSDAELFCEYFDISEEGNWEGSNILRILRPVEVFALEKGLQADVFRDSLEKDLQTLRERQDRRIRPGLDDKLILGWNALMLKAYARAAVVLRDDQFTKAAAQNALFIQANLAVRDGRGEMKHTFKSGVANYPAFLDDYAYWIASLIELYRATWNEQWLEAALMHCSYVVKHFSDGDGIFFHFTHQEQTDVIVRKKEIYDGATPSGNAVMAENLLQLSVLFDRADWRDRALTMLGMLAPTVVKYPGSFGIWARLLLQQTSDINEIVVTGTNYDEVAKQVLSNFIPNLVIMASATENEHFPMLSGKGSGEKTLIYLCRNYACLSPFPDVKTLMQNIDKSNKIT